VLKVSNIKLSIENRGEVLSAVSQKLNISKDDIISIKIIKESFDARKRHQCYVYTLEVELENEDYILSKNIKNVSMLQSREYKINIGNKISNRISPIIVGSGPCGLFVTYALAKVGLKPILLERGSDVDRRVKKVKNFWTEGELGKNTNVQFGEGGAGTFSDGKLTTNIKNIRCKYVLDTFVNFGAPESILYSYQPHIGTDNLRKVVKLMRESILDLGGQVLFDSLVTDILIKSNKVEGVVVNNNTEILSDIVVLAIGHSARDTYRMLGNKDVLMKPKPFSIGLRIEHLQSDLNYSQYEEYANHPNVDPATYKLKYHSKNNRSAYSFCMCPGGVVVASSSNEGEVVTNGMSYYNRAGRNANSAILVGVSPKDFASQSPFAGIEFQKKWEKKAYEAGGRNFSAPVQLVGDFLKNKASKEVGKVKPTYRPSVKLANLNEVIPSYVSQTLKEAIIFWDKYVKGFSDEESLLTGVETRSSSPLRIIRNERMESSVKGLYVGGEGAGYAGGIMSAAVDGLKLAENIINLEQTK